MSSYHSSRSRFRKDVSENFRQQSDLIVQSAKRCMESKGVQKTTLVDIAREANMTRELIYYYFSGKQEIIDELIESYVQDAVETARLWCDTWDDPNASDEDVLPREAYIDAVASVRRFLHDSSGVRRPMHDLLREANRDLEFFSRACAAMTSELGSHGTAKRLIATFIRIGNNRVKEALEFYLAGVVGVIESSNITDEEIVDLLCLSVGHTAS